MSGKCPKCEGVISRYRLEEVDGSASMIGGTTWRCLNFICPRCNTIVSVQIDPIAIRTDIIEAIKGRRT